MNSSYTFPIEASQLKINGHCVINDKPCRIVDMSTSKPGKHGHAKVNITGIDIFTSKKIEYSCPVSNMIDVPVIKKTQYTVVDISDDDYVTLLGVDNTLRSDIKLPEDLADYIHGLFQLGKPISVTVQSALGQETIITSNTL
jgi:translation initiation factor 5A